MGWFGIGERDEPVPGGMDAAEFTSRMIEEALNPGGVKKKPRFGAKVRGARYKDAPLLYDADGVRVGTRCTCTYDVVAGVLQRTAPSFTCPRHKGR